MPNLFAQDEATKLSAFLKMVKTDYFGLVLRCLPEISRIAFTHTIPMASRLFRKKALIAIHHNSSRQQAT